MKNWKVGQRVASSTGYTVGVITEIGYPVFLGERSTQEMCHVLLDQSGRKASELPLIPATNDTIDHWYNEASMNAWFIPERKIPERLTYINLWDIGFHIVCIHDSWYKEPQDVFWMSKDPIVMVKQVNVLGKSKLVACHLFLIRVGDEGDYLYPTLVAESIDHKTRGVPVKWNKKYVPNDYRSRVK